jgi:predicted nucleic acid-binding protein
MTTAIDSNILIDVIGLPNIFTDPAIRALNDHLRLGALIVCPVVVAEIGHYYSSAAKLRAGLEAMRLEMIAFDQEDLHRAGGAYVEYCRKSTAPRSRMLADFLIGAHACRHADALLTRDRGYYRTYFSDLRLIEPGT